MTVKHVFSNTVADWTGTVTVGNSAGATQTIAATDLVRPTNWNSEHNQLYTLTGNTTLSSTASGTNVIWGATGAEISLVGSSDSIYISSPPHISSFENFPGAMINTDGTDLFTGNQSHSIAMPFLLPKPISASFIRFFGSFDGGQVFIATTASSGSASGEMYTTWNWVIYSLGVGASSRSLMSVISSSVGWTIRNSISVAANGTQYSLTQQFTYAVEGNTTVSSQTSARSTNSYMFTQFANFTGNRAVDFNFVGSLAAGNYWLIWGMSTNSATNSTRFTALTQAQHASWGSDYYAFNNTTPPGSPAVMGSTNKTNPPLYGGGSFSTAGGGTTSALPLSAISSRSVLGYFQILRSA